MDHRPPIDQLDLKELGARQSAVLILLYPRENQWHVVFILRPTYSGVHSGQIGFPGGKAEPEDENLEQTALREAEEEIAADRNTIEVVGSLSPLYVPPSNYLIHPYVGLQSLHKPFMPEEKEVAEIVEVPLHFLLNNEVLKDASIVVREGSYRQVKGYQLEKHLVWGATGMILHEFILLLKETIPAGGLK
jgi:8-oxo-dGTP pyrophosphatase MutT (NUDIX family)